MKKKQILALIMSAALTLSLTACSDNREQPNDSKDNSSKTTTSSEKNTSDTENSGSDESKDNNSSGSENSKPEESSSGSGTSAPETSEPASSASGDIYTQEFWDSLPETPGSEFEYEILAEGIKVTKYTGTSDTVKVPQVIDGEPVREVRLSNDDIKVYCPPDGLTELNIPSSVTALYVPGSLTVFNNQYSATIKVDNKNYSKNASFLRGNLRVAPNLESITFGSGIKSVALCDPDQNQYDVTLKYIHLPEGLENLYRSCFSGCTSLESIVIPNSAITISAKAFKGCTSLKNVILSDDTTVYAEAFDETPFLEETAAKADSYVKIGASIYDGSKCTGDIVIPDGIKVIAAGSFERNDKITSLTLPSSVMEIDASAFAGCARLKTVTINSSPEIFKCAFMDCLRLEEVNCTGTPVNRGTKYDDSDVSISPKYPFANCPNLKTKPF